MELLVALIVISIISVALAIFRLRKYLIVKLRQYNMSKNFDGPRAYPIIGNAVLFLGNLNVITKRMIELSQILEFPARLWVGSELYVILEDPMQFEIITKNSHGLEKSKFYDYIKPCVGNGLLTASASIWKIHRKLLNQQFKENIFATMTDKVVRHSNKLVKILDSSNEKELDVFSYVQLCTMDVVYDSFLALDLDLQSKPECKLHKNLQEIINIGIERIYKIWLQPDIIFFNLPIGKRCLKLISDVNKITDQIIRKKKESMVKNEVTQELRDEDSGKNSSAFLDSLFESFYYDGKYTETEIQNEVNTIILTGSDTSANAITFTLLMLATYPEIQKKVYDELLEIYGTSDPEDIPITNQDIKKMEYMELVIKETLRLFPTAPLIGRYLTGDIKVGKNKVIPKNSQVIFLIFTLHRNEKYWNDPLRFNPDRFLPGNYDSKYFRPFGFVKRNCIGQEFALYEMKIILATVLRKFIIRIDDPINVQDIPLIFGMTLKSAKTILLRFIRR